MTVEELRSRCALYRTYSIERGEGAMKNTNLPLLKFCCDNRDCLFECYVNQNNNLLTHYNPSMSALLDWTCPDCKTGALRFSPNNTKFEFSLTKAERLAQERSQRA
jgi:hypothetical protein